MSDIAVQASFNSGEWAPGLYARVDIVKYRSGAALLNNFFVDYRGGASTRAGTKYVIRCRDSTNPVRLIPFQATSTVGYAIEFGNFYARFIFQGSPVVETGFAISGATQANPCVITVVGNNFTSGDTIFIQNVAGMTQLNGRYFNVQNVSGNNVTLGDLNGTNLNSTGYGAYVSGGTASRIYTITTPYSGAQLAQLKYAQADGTRLVICHPSFTPYILTIVNPTNWTLTPISIGSQAIAPTINTSSTNLASGIVNYAYQVTSIDNNGEESSPSVTFNINNLQDMRTTAGTISITWGAVSGAASYNVYKADASYLGTIPFGSTFGFIGQSSGTTFADTNIAPDYNLTPPLSQNPFVGGGLASVVVNSSTNYIVVPSATVVGASSVTATVSAVLQVVGTPGVASGGSGYNVGDLVNFGNGVMLVVATVSGGAVTTWRPITNPSANPGSLSGAGNNVPANPVSQLSTSGAGTGATTNLTWQVGQVFINSRGAGYSAAPSITFSAGSVSCTTTIFPNTSNYPTVPSFFQQRLILAGSVNAPQTFNGSQPGNFFNFNFSLPVKANDAIQGTLVSGVLNTIRSIVSAAAGMLLLTDKGAWIVNGGTSGSAISPDALVANPQAQVGANDLPPIVANYDVLYVQEKGSSVRDLAYNIYFNIFTGTDISIISSHLFFGYQIKEWCWAEEPFKLVWAVRSDGTILTLTFLKEQDFIAWTHQTTTNGLFQSVCAVTEASTSIGFADGVYTVVQRVINGVTVKYIERVADRIFPSGAVDVWAVDAGLQYIGSPATSFTGAEHLAGQTVTGLADGVVIPPFTMPLSGFFTLGSPASKVTIGLPMTCQLQTLALDIGEPTIQGKVKAIPFVDIRVKDTLGLTIGKDFNTQFVMKDLVNGNVSSMLTGQENQVINGLVTGDARTFLNTSYTVPGQYCLQQTLPYPATILGVFPAVVQGDVSERQR